MPIFDRLRSAASSAVNSSLGSAVAQGATGAVASGIIGGAVVAGGKAYDALTKARDFKHMMNSPFNADLQEHASARPEHFNAAFTSLRRTNPNLSKDPMVAGTYMRRMMEFGPTAAGSVLVEALHQRSTNIDPLTDAINRGAQSGVQGALSERMHQRMDDRRIQGNFEGKIEQQRLNARVVGTDAGGNPILHGALQAEHANRLSLQKDEQDFRAKQDLASHVDAQKRERFKFNLQKQLAAQAQRDRETLQVKDHEAQAAMARERERVEGLKVLWDNGFVYPDPTKYVSTL